ncbi:MAG: GAF domain-containing sensor histidine kinase [Rubrivivax sp.]|nr:MAG: GAF domain-containing sensor histidine kinase [Rubrivivax sp.]
MEDSEDAIARDLALVSRLSAVPMILRVVSQVTDMGYSVVARVSEQHWVACAVKDDIGFNLPPGGRLKIETTLCREVRAERVAVVIDDVDRDPTYRDHHTPAMYGLKSYISVPIVLEDGEYFGNLCAIDSRPRHLSAPQTLDMFKLFAELIARQLDAERRHVATGTALADARAVGELREQFIAVLGHDLRNPLSSIGAIGHVLTRPGQPMDVPTLGQRLINSTRRMSAMIDDVLDFARGRLGGGLEIRLQPEVALEALLSQVVAELQIAHEGRVIVSNIEVPGAVVCDSARIQQLLSNLVKNALTHGAPDSPVTVQVTVVSAPDQGKRLVLSVHNEGDPIPPEQLRKVTEPYWRPAGAKPGQGLGLGLYICTQIAHAHGGSLAVSSTQVGGTTFRVEVPGAH